MTFEVTQAFRAVQLGALLAVATGCTIVDDGALRTAEGMVSGETGPTMFGANRCGQSETPLINSLTAGEPILIDTTVTEYRLHAPHGARPH